MNQCLSREKKKRKGIELFSNVHYMYEIPIFCKHVISGKTYYLAGRRKFENVKIKICFRDFLYPRGDSIYVRFDV